MSLFNFEQFQQQQSENGGNKASANYEASFVTTNTQENVNSYKLSKQCNDIRNYNNFRSSSALSRSFYMSQGDFLWSQNYSLFKDDNGNTLANSVQNIILNQYQPDFQYSIAQQLIKMKDGAVMTQVKGAWNTLVGAVDSTIGGIFKTVMPVFGESIYNGVKAVASDGSKMFGRWAGKAYCNHVINDCAKNPGELYDAQEYDGITNPMYNVKNLFMDGTWLNTYQLPFINKQKNKDFWLANAKNDGSWSIGRYRNIGV